MTPILPPDENALAVLNRSVAEAVRFFSHADPGLSDGYWTAHDALAHIVFWHCQAVSVAHSLIEGREPTLAEGPRIELNHCACEELSHQPPAALAAQLAVLLGLLSGGWVIFTECKAIFRSRWADVIAACRTVWPGSKRTSAITCGNCAAPRAAKRISGQGNSIYYR